jgi:hypothetical protein
MTAALLGVDHLLALTDATGVFEHADHAIPRREHGYCVDDVARALIVVAREPQPTREMLVLARTAFRFLSAAQGADGRVRNRRSTRGRWHGRRGVEDCWGRTVWAFGTAAHRAPERWMQESGLARFERGAEQRSPWPRAMAFAALGAAEVHAIDPANRRARSVLADAIDVIGAPTSKDTWAWPEPRLAYANAALAEALIAAGAALERAETVDDGLRMLRWLLERETTAGHLSPTPVGGSGSADRPPAFDQQPIEIAAMADACSRAAFVTGDATWVRGVSLAVDWFAGNNDGGVVMSDARSGGGYDGLQVDGPNLNQGAESTLSLITTMQHGRRLAATPA